MTSEVLIVKKEMTRNAVKFKQVNLLFLFLHVINYQLIHIESF